MTNHTTGWIARKDHYTVPVLFNPYTGEPRDVRDVQSDPQGILIVPPGNVDVLAAPTTQPVPQQEAQEPFAWHVCSVNSDGSLSLEHAAAWEEAAHDHINDAITELDIEGAGSWVVRPAYHAPQTSPAAQAAPENIRSILARCRDFIDTTKAPAYPAGADLADEIDVLLAAQPAPQPSPTAQRDALDAARWHWIAEYLVGPRTDLDDEIVASETVNELRKLVDADRAAQEGV